MCYRPLHIFNPKKNPTFRDRVYLDVPCGKCEECRKRVRNDWFVRTFFQYKETIDKYHGICLYITLTYNNACLPLFTNFDTGEIIPSFSKDDVQKFLKRFRIRLQRRFGVELTGVKYLITSEYGGQTHRPHYHGLLFIPFPCCLQDVYEIKDMVIDTWQYGFVSFGRKLEGIKTAGLVQSPAALSYVCKYISKDLNFPFEDVPKDYAPFHLQSNGYGEYMIEHFGLKSGSTFALATLIDGTFLLGETTMFPYAIPQYITRKVLYDYHYQCREEEFKVCDYATGVLKHKEISYVLNDLGKKIKQCSEFHSIEFQVSEFDRIFGSVESALASDSSLLFSRLSYPFLSNQSLIDYVHDNYLDMLPYEKIKFATYVRVFKDRCVIPHAGYMNGVPDAYCLEDVTMYLDDIYQNDSYILETLPSLSDMQDFRSTYNFRNNLYHYCYNSSLKPQTQDLYEILLQIFNAITFVIGTQCELESLKKQQEYDNAKLLCKEVI